METLKRENVHDAKIDVLSKLCSLMQCTYLMKIRIYKRMKLYIFHNNLAACRLRAIDLIYIFQTLWYCITLPLPRQQRIKGAWISNIA